jgi:hypothetical protein
MRLFTIVGSATSKLGGPPASLGSARTLAHVGEACLPTKDRLDPSLEPRGEAQGHEEPGLQVAVPVPALEPHRRRVEQLDAVTVALLVVPGRVSLVADALLAEAQDGRRALLREGPQRLARPAVPHAPRIVGGPARQALAVWAPRHALDLLGVPLEGPQRLAGAGLPQAHRLVMGPAR